MSPRVRAHRAPRRRWLGVSALIVLGLTAALAAAQPQEAALQLPPVQQPASHEHHPGKIIWMELVTPDIAGAQRFYGELFGWTFQPVPSARVPYYMALAHGEPVAAFVEPHASRHARRHPFWLPFIAAKDVSGIKEAAVDQGGKVLSPARTYEGRGEQAVLADPQGAVFGVLQSASGDPPDELADPGEWIWASLLTTDPKAGATFYQHLFGYEAQPLPNRQGQDDDSHWLLSSEGFARASANELPPGGQKELPYWLPFVRVLNTETATAKVKTLGGSVITPVHTDRDGGRVAVVADPAGTPFGLMEWREQASAGPQEHRR